MKRIIICSDGTWDSPLKERPTNVLRLSRGIRPLDETRKDFLPTLWDPKPGLDLDQVWFAGVHKDVGGGYPESGLSDAAFRWLLAEATEAQLRVEEHLTASIFPDPADRQHNEYKGFYRRLGRKAVRQLPTGSRVHRSVKQRWDAVPGYRKSQALETFLARVDNDWSAVDLAE